MPSNSCIGQPTARVDIGTGFSHVAIQIDNLKATVEAFPWSKQHRQIPPPRNRLNQAMTAHRIACQVRTVITESKEDTMARSARR